jgi:hypothetical protein
MKSQLKRALRRTDGTPATMFCCHGMIYPVTAKVLGIVIDSADEILDHLRQIDGVKVVAVYGGLTNLMFPTLRLPEVTRVLVPLDSRLASSAPAIAAHRGRIW